MFVQMDLSCSPLQFYFFNRDFYVCLDEPFIFSTAILILVFFLTETFMFISMDLLYSPLQFYFYFIFLTETFMFVFLDLLYSPLQFYFFDRDFYIHLDEGFMFFTAILFLISLFNKNFYIRLDRPFIILFKEKIISTCYI